MKTFFETFKIYIFALVTLILVSPVFGYFIGLSAKTTYSASFKINIPQPSDTVNPQSALVNAKSYNTFFKSTQFVNLTKNILSRNNASIKVDTSASMLGDKVIIEIKTISLIPQKAKKAAKEISQLIENLYYQSRQSELSIFTENFKDLKNQLNEVNKKIKSGYSDGSLELAKYNIIKEISEIKKKIDNINKIKVSNTIISRNIPEINKYVLLAFLTSVLFSGLAVFLLYYFHLAKTYN